MDLYKKLEEIEKLRDKLDKCQENIERCNKIINNSEKVKMIISFDNRDDVNISWKKDDDPYYDDFIEIFGLMKIKFEKETKEIENEIEKIFCSCKSKKKK